MSGERFQPGPAHWFAFWVMAICGGPMIALLVGLALHGLARSFGWAS